MGLERGPGFLRRPSRGWIAARAFPVEHAILEEKQDADGGRRAEIDTSYGLSRRLGVPAFVDPADPTQLWVDWDAAFQEHREAWDRKERIDREIASRAYEHIWGPRHAKAYGPG
jgi:hypothetical protein